MRPRFSIHGLALARRPLAVGHRRLERAISRFSLEGYPAADTESPRILFVAGFDSDRSFTGVGRSPALSAMR